MAQLGRERADLVLVLRWTPDTVPRRAFSTSRVSKSLDLYNKTIPNLRLRPDSTVICQGFTSVRLLVLPRPDFRSPHTDLLYARLYTAERR